MFQLVGSFGKKKKTSQRWGTCGSQYKSILLVQPIFIVDTIAKKCGSVS